MYFKLSVFRTLNLVLILIFLPFIVGFQPVKDINDTRMFAPIVTESAKSERDNFYVNSLFSYMAGDRLETQSMKLSSGNEFSAYVKSDFDIGLTLNLTPWLVTIHSFRMQGAQLDFWRQNDLIGSINCAIYRADLNSYAYGGSLQYHMTDTNIWFSSIQRRYLAKDFMHDSRTSPIEKNHISTLENLDTIVFGFEKRFPSYGRFGTSYLRLAYYYNSINSIGIRFEEYPSNYKRSNYDSIAVEIGFIGPDLSDLSID